MFRSITQRRCLAWFGQKTFILVKIFISTLKKYKYISKAVLCKSSGWMIDLSENPNLQLIYNMECMLFENLAYQTLHCIN